MRRHYIADISNIAGDDNEFPPKVENIQIMFDTLRPQNWILGIADWKLFSCIDYPEYYREYITKRWIIEAPPSISADILMIQQAIKSGWPIITNDRFLDHCEELISASWIKLHRVPFIIFEGKFKIFLPKSVE